MGSSVNRPSSVVCPSSVPNRCFSRSQIRSYPVIQQLTLSHSRITCLPTGCRKIRL